MPVTNALKRATTIWLSEIMVIFFSITFFAKYNPERSVNIHRICFLKEYDRHYSLFPTYRHIASYSYRNYINMYSFYIIVSILKSSGYSFKLEKK